MDPYLDPFMKLGGSMISLAKGNRSQQVTDACKKYGGFYLGSIGGPAAVLAKENIKKVECLEYPELGMEVAAGNIAALVVDSAVADALIKSNPDLALATFEFDPNEVNYGKAAVIAKGNEDFVAAVNEVITKVASDGSFQKAYDDAVALADSMGLEMD